MAEPLIKWQQIINKLKEILEYIIESHGYTADLGENVYDWKVTPYGQEQIPGVSINDSTDSIENEGGDIAFDTHILSLKINIKFLGNAEKGRKIIGDIYYTLGETDKKTLDGLLNETVNWLNSSMDFEHKDKLIGSIEISLELKYRTNHFNPYE